MSGEVQDTFYWRSPSRHNLDYLEFALQTKAYKYRFNTLVKFYEENELPNFQEMKKLAEIRLWENIFNACFENAFHCYIWERAQLYIVLDVIEELCLDFPTQRNHWRKNYVKGLFNKPKKEIDKIVKANAEYINWFSLEYEYLTSLIYRNCSGWTKSICEKSLEKKYSLSLYNYATKIISEDFQCKHFIYMFSNYPKDWSLPNISEWMPYFNQSCDTGKTCKVNLADVCVIPIPKQKRFLKYFENKNKRNAECCMYIPQVNLLFAVYDNNIDLLLDKIRDENSCVTAEVYDFTKMFELVESSCDFSFEETSFYLKIWGGFPYRYCWTIKNDPDSDDQQKILAKDFQLVILFYLSQSYYNVITSSKQ